MKITSICLHHSAISYTKNKDQFKAINNYHKGLWDFKSSLGYYVGYTYHISSKGKVRKARRVGEKTAACYQGGMNEGQCIHICLDGNFDTEKPTPAEIFALRDLLIELAEKYNIPKEKIYAHSDFASKTCPGINFDLAFARGLIPGLVKSEKSRKREVLKAVDKLKEMITKINFK